MPRWFLAGICQAALLIGLFTWLAASHGQETGRPPQSEQPKKSEPKSEQPKPGKGAPAEPGDADSSGKKKALKPADKKPEENRTRTLAGITPAREAAVAAFVKANHPELAELLNYLKEASPKEYERAVRDLHKASERLAQIQEKDGEAYELSLAAWRAQSRIHLLGARWHMKHDPAVKELLRQAIEEQVEIELSLRRLEQERLAARLQKLDVQVRDLEQNRELTAKRRLEMITGGKPTSQPVASPDSASFPSNLPPSPKKSPADKRSP